MHRLKALLSDQSGLATLVLTPFLLVSIVIVVSAWTLVSQVAQTQRAVQTALAYTLRVAAVQGTTTLPDGAFLLDPATALAAAQQAVPVALPVALRALSASGATYTPNSQAPTTWGTVSLESFTTGNDSQAAGGTVCYGSSPPLASCPYVQATISMPYSVSLFGYPIDLTDTITETQVLDTFNGQSFGS